MCDYTHVRLSILLQAKTSLKHCFIQYMPLMILFQIVYCLPNVPRSKEYIFIVIT